MRKLFSLLLVLGLGIVLVSGCQTTTSTGGTEVPEGSDIAGSVGLMLYQGTYVDAVARGGIGIAGVSAADVKAARSYDESSGWWTFTATSAAITYDFKARAYTTGNVEITTSSLLSTTDKLAIAATATLGTTVTYTFGTVSNPLVFDGFLAPPKSIDGPISLAVISDGHTTTFSFTYSGIELDEDGYPASGSADFSFTSDLYVAVSGTVTFNGSTATVEFDAPSDLVGESYTISTVNGQII